MTQRLTPQQILDTAKEEALAMFDKNPGQAAAHFTDSLMKHNVTKHALTNARIGTWLQDAIVNNRKGQFEYLINTVEVPK